MTSPVLPSVNDGDRRLAQAMVAAVEAFHAAILAEEPYAGGTLAVRIDETGRPTAELWRSMPSRAEPPYRETSSQERMDALAAKQLHEESSARILAAAQAALPEDTVPDARTSGFMFTAEPDRHLNTRLLHQNLRCADARSRFDCWTEPAPQIARALAFARSGLQPPPRPKPTLKLWRSFWRFTCQAPLDSRLNLMGVAHCDEDEGLQAAVHHLWQIAFHSWLRHEEFLGVTLLGEYGRAGEDPEKVFGSADLSHLAASNSPAEALIAGMIAR